MSRLGLLLLVVAVIMVAEITAQYPGAFKRAEESRMAAEKRQAVLGFKKEVESPMSAEKRQSQLKFKKDFKDAMDRNTLQYK